MGHKDKPNVAMAIAQSKSTDASGLIKQLDGKTIVPFGFELLKIEETRKGVMGSEDLSGLRETWQDYQPNDLHWPLMSEKLKDIVKDHLTGKEGMRWLKCKVHGEGEARTYYIPRFAKKLDVLDKDGTTYISGKNRVHLPVFALSKIIQYAIFHEADSHNFWKISLFLLSARR